MLSIPLREIDTDFHLAITLKRESDITDAGSHVFIVHPIASLCSWLLHPVARDHDRGLFGWLSEISCASISGMQNGIIAAKGFQPILHDVGGEIRPVPFIAQMRGVAGRAGAFLCPYSLLPCLLDEAAINIPVDDSMKVYASSLPSPKNIDRLELFPGLLVKPHQLPLEAGNVSSDFCRCLIKCSRRIGKTHPVITRLEILLEEKQALLLCALILPSSHLLLSRLFADPLPIPLSIPP